MSTEIKHILANIRSMVAEFSGVSVEDMEGKSRKAEIVLARRRFCYLSRFNTNYSLQEIGNHLGGRDHTTVIHSVQKMKDFLETETSELIEIQQLEKRLSIRLDSTVDILINRAFDAVGGINEHISKIIKDAWREGYEEGKRIVPKTIVQEKIVIKKVYVYSNQEIEDEPSKKVRHKGVYSNPQYSH